MVARRDGVIADGVEDVDHGLAAAQGALGRALEPIPGVEHELGTAFLADDGGQRGGAADQPFLSPLALLPRHDPAVDVVGVINHDLDRRRGGGGDL